MARELDTEWSATESPGDANALVGDMRCTASFTVLVPAGPQPAIRWWKLTRLPRGFHEVHERA